MDLHKLVMYVKQHKADVKQILHKIIAQKSDLSELAQILLEKTEGRYHSRDYELNRLGLSAQEKEQFITARNEYIQTHGYNLLVNPQEANYLDRALAPFKKTIEVIVQKGSRAHIIEDTETLVFPEYAGKRSFVPNIECGGYFYDSLRGVNKFGPGMPSTVIMHKNELLDKDKSNTLAHEFNHNFLHEILDEEDSTTLSRLYKQAVKDKKCLDDYAALNVSEYFAQGYEAYCSIYKPHISMIDNSDYVYGGSCHVRSTLKRKDPELYNFIEYCIKKYN